MDVGAWLRGLGLEQYEPAFRDNDIDAEVLPELTAEHLKELGLPLGPRLKLLKAIAAFRAASPTAGNDEPAASSAEVSESARPGAGVPEAERRQLTVMFVDLVGSTALSGRLDPEDMRAVIRAYQDTCAGVITRFEGHVAKYMGDGVLAYFGYPKAHEDNAERAVRAGLELVEAVGALEPRDDLTLQVRVGVATGLVVVGDLIGEGAAREEAVVGETPNLAARLQALAAPNAVVIGPTTRRLVDGLFDLVALGACDLKGFAGQVSAWRVLGSSAAESRFEARQVAGLTPLVGREHELGLLLERWEQAKEGEGQVVLLSGEPGVGKSRLLYALRERLGGEPHTPLSHVCSPFHTSSALYPVVGLLERVAGFTRDDPPERRLDKLNAILAVATTDIREAVPLIAELLAIPSGDRYPPLDLTPQRRRERTFEVLVDQLAGLAAGQPVLALWEDVHWIDPTSLELLGRVVERAQRLPVLVVITFRPEFSPPWKGHAHVTVFSLSRLTRKQIAAMVERVTGGKALPARVAAQIVAKADGVPLFVEELTKAVLEAGLLQDGGGRRDLAGPPPAIPATLHDSLVARLDRLPSAAKEVAQVGAVIGREFDHGLLAAVAPLSEERLRDALEQLVRAELVFRSGTPPEAVYTFKHALVRDAAYQSLLKSRRQQLHGGITRVLEEQFAETVETEPEVLARHCTEAGLTEKAIGYWHKAGELAVARSAMEEAVIQLTAGLQALDALPPNDERDRRELGLQATLGVALWATRGQAASETGGAYARACELAERLGEKRQRLPVLYGLSTHDNTRADLRKGGEAAAALLKLADEQGDDAGRAAGRRMLGTISLELGELAAACTHLEATIALPDSPDPLQVIRRYGIDSRVVAQAYLAWASLLSGRPEQACAHQRQSLLRARERGHPSTLAQALFCGCTVRQLQGDAEGVKELAGVMDALAREQAFALWSAMAVMFEGWALARAGEAGRSTETALRGLAAYRATGAELWQPYFLALCAEAQRYTGQTAEACGLIDEALARAARTEERWYEAELCRIRGEMLPQAAPADGATAEARLREAIAVARKQGAKWWELRAATSLARLWRDQGRRGEARDLLAPVYRWFTEGCDRPDLQDAKALLDVLR